MNVNERESDLIAQGPPPENRSIFAELLLEWIDQPLIVAENDIVVDANHPACAVCGWTRDAFAGLTLGASIDVLYQNSRGAQVDVYRMDVDGKHCQVAVMRLPVIPLPEILDQGFDAYWMVGLDGNFVEVSETYAALTGYSSEELRAMTIHEVDRYTASRIAGVRLTGYDHFEIRQTVRDSPQLADLQVTLSVLPRTGGHVLGCLRDVTDSRRAEAEAVRASRFLSLVGASIRLAQKARDRAELLSGTCESLVNWGGYALSWVAIADSGGGGTVRVEASFGESLEYLHDHQVPLEHTGLGGSGGRGERVAMCSDFEAAEPAPWRERAIRYGFASSVSLQIQAEGRPEAALMIYAREPDAFDHGALQVLAQVADALEIGLDVLRKRSMQKAMEQNAHAWDESFREAFEHSLQGMLVYDLEGKILDANAELCNRLGYTRQELLGAGLDRIVAPEYIQIAGQRLKAIRNDGFAVFECGHVCRDGSTHRVELSCRTYTYGEDQIVLAISRDLAQPVSETSKSLHLALEASQTGLFDWDLRTNRIIYSNEWKSQLGYSDTEITDDFAEWELRVHPDDQESMVQGLDAWLNKPEEPYEAEFRMRHKDGSYRWMLARGAILYGSTGKPERMLGSQVDVTVRKRTQQQANNVQKLESVGRMASGAGQDFDHLLTIINGYSDLILSDLFEGDPLKEKLRAIREAGRRAGALTQRLLELSPREPALLPLDLNTIVAGSLDTVRRLIGSAIHFVAELCPEPAYINADPGQLSQLVVNLALNAREAMPKGGQLTIRVAMVAALPPHLSERGLTPAPYIRLTVADNGAGIDKETQLRIFDPWFSTKDNARGHGLALVSGIVNQHAGAIAVTSELGQGTAFDVYFPAAAPAFRSAANGEEVSAPRAAVLVVEQEPALRKLAAEILTRAGYTVLEATNAGEALLVQDTAEAPSQLRTIQLEKSFTAESLLAQVARTVNA